MEESTPKLTRSTKGKPQKNSARMSKYEKRHARMLYIRGKTQQQIAEAIGFSRAAVQKLKSFEGDWEEHRLPNFTDLDVLANLKDILYRIQSGLVDENDPEIDNKINNIKKLVVAIRHLQELLNDVENRDLQISLRKHMAWLAEEGSEDVEPALRAAQRHHDWCQEHL